jgi:hypothetical protein
LSGVSHTQAQLSHEVQFSSIFTPKSFYDFDRYGKEDSKKFCPNAFPINFFAHSHVLIAMANSLLLHISFSYVRGFSDDVSTKKNSDAALIKAS